MQLQGGIDTTVLKLTNSLPMTLSSGTTPITLTHADADALDDNDNRSKFLTMTLFEVQNYRKSIKQRHDHENGPDDMVQVFNRIPGHFCWDKLYNTYQCYCY